VVLVGIIEMYVGIPKNHISIIVIKCICANGIAIPLVIIALGTIIIGGWFYKKNDRL
jgi:cation transport ATPase